MIIRAILAHDEQWGIGKDGGLPWPSNSDDLQWFKDNTLNTTVIMGRNTWDSLPLKPLRNRNNIVVSSTMEAGVQQVEVVHPDNYKARVADIQDLERVWIIGGAQLIIDSLDIIDELWLNNVGNDYSCDVFLPKEEITSGYTARDVTEKSFGTITRWIRNTDA
jgi:dihydrofolate reductase